ncbi:DUF4157 domain-containing protein [Paraburkholderia sp. MM6662-R1]|uniref:eCIS core domain-containing protein n=1 Tax=Paraburkholderia sp. MM6662-R1 TaxID=2991066 RepID=UPI003D1E410A
MFAPKVVKATTKATENPGGKRAPQRLALAARTFGGGTVEQALMLQRGIGNQTTLRLLAQQASRLAGSVPDNDHEQEAAPEDMIARAAPRGASWDLSKIPPFPPERTNQLKRFPRHLGNIQLKLALGSVDDPLEHEADRIAESVMRTPMPEFTITGSAVQLSRKCEACEKDERGQVQAKPVGPTIGGADASPIVTEVLSSSGQRLDTSTRSFFEPRFNHDFSHVRVHADDRAAVAANAIGARAFAIGHDLVFGNGNFSPNTESGRWLLSHELAHVVQTDGRSEATRPIRETVLRQSTAASGSPGSPDPCGDILQQILDLLNLVADLINNALNDPHNLYKYFRDTPHPEYGSWKGHRDNFYRERERLSLKIAEWEADDRCRGYPLSEQQQEELKEAYEYKEKEFPSKPAPSMYEEQESNPAGQPSTSSTWDNVLKVVIVLGLSIALVPTIVAALADPEPASKLALAGLTLVEISALSVALGFTAPSSSAGAEA